MNKINFQNLSVYFFIFSFLGWVTEVIYTAAIKKQIVNRGFLAGPLCPIYGFGMLLIILLLYRFDKSDDLPMIWIFIMGLILCSSVEMLGGFLLEKLFNLRWWDYSAEPLNINGYVCLKFSIFWGLGVVLITDIIRHIKMSGHLIDFSTLPYTKIILVVLYIVLFVDLGITLLTLSRLGHEIQKINEVKNSFSIPAESLSKFLGGTTILISNRYSRLMNAFPKLKEGILSLKK